MRCVAPAPALALSGHLTGSINDGEREGRGVEFNFTFEYNLNPNPGFYVQQVSVPPFKNKLCSTYLHSGKQYQHSQ